MKPAEMEMIDMEAVDMEVVDMRAIDARIKETDEMDMREAGLEEVMKILCVANSYEQKYYLNPDFMGLPKTVRDELQIMSVLFTEDVGGILTLGFEPDGTLTLNVTHEDDDFFFDEIGSELKIKQIQMTQQTLLENLETYYKVFFLGEKM